MISSNVPPKPSIRAILSFNYVKPLPILIKMETDMSRNKNSSQHSDKWVLKEKVLRLVFFLNSVSRFLKKTPLILCVNLKCDFFLIS